MIDPTGLDGQYLSRADIYRLACQPTECLSEIFVSSLRFRLIQDDPGRWDETGCRFSANWNVALRAAISEAWDDYRLAEHTLSREVSQSSCDHAHGKRYTAMKVILSIARGMYRNTVSDEERTM